jgi:Family of unknown function (DUF5522)
MSNNEILRAVREKMQRMREGEDFYWEGRLMVFTSAYHRRRGYCCGTGCRHCPYDPKWTKDTTHLNEQSADSKE